MQKFFSKLIEYKKELIREFEGKSGSIEQDEKLVSYLKYLLIVFGESFFVKKDFDYDSFYKDLLLWLKEKQKLKVEAEELEEIKLLKLSQDAKILKMLGLTQPMMLTLFQFETNISFFLLPISWIDNPVIDTKLEKISFWSNFANGNIKKYITEYIFSQYSQKELNRVSANNYYAEDVNEQFQSFMLSELDENENLLSCLKVGAIRSLALNKDEYKNLKWLFVMTNYETMLFGFEKNGKFSEAFDLKNRRINVKNGIRNPVIVDNYEWTTTLNNVQKYKEIEEISAIQGDLRQNKIAILNVKKSGNTFKYYDFARYLLQTSTNVTKSLSIFLLDYLKDSKAAIEEYTKDEKLVNILSDLLNQTDIEEQLVFWYKDWNPPTEQAIFVVKMLTEIAKDDKILSKKILPFHRLIYADIKKKEKDKLNKLLIDIDFANHLISAAEFKEAEKLLKTELKKLTDLSFAELLPNENIDPTSTANGQIMKLVLLELLAKTQQGQAKEEYLKQAAILQPLSTSRLEKIIEAEDEKLSQKANKVLEIISKENLKPNETKETGKYKTLDSSSIEIIKHPLYSNKGVFKSITKFLASQKLPDSETIKNFAETLDTVKYPEISEILTDLRLIFKLPPIDVFISHGNKSIGIRGYKATKPYIIIGSEHLKPESEYYLNYNELKYALSEEIAFIYFGFARITSSDIWRGAMEKGKVVADTLLNFVPIIGSLSSVAKIKAFSKFVEKNSVISKTANVANKSKEILLTSSEALGIIKNMIPNAQEEKQQNFIAISRMMQLTADRAAICITGDIVPAVRSIFLRSKDLKENLKIAQKYGLNAFLLQKDEQGNYMHNNLAIRLASLFSFYLSDDFEKIRQKII